VIEKGLQGRKIRKNRGAGNARYGRQRVWAPVTFHP